MNRQTTFLNAGTVEQGWHVMDADGQVLGRLATQIATVLMGKHRPGYTAHCDTGEFVVVINADKFVLTGRKAEQKYVKSFSGHPGGLKMVPYGEVMKKRPEMILELAVKRMLPKSDLGRHMLKKLKVYSGPNHPHQAQQPEAYELKAARA